MSILAHKKAGVQSFGAVHIMVKNEIAEKIFEAISDKPISFYRLCRRTKMHARTVKKYLDLIQNVQSKEKVGIEQRGFRLFITKKKIS